VETGRKYRQAILEAGGSRPAMESFKAFPGPRTIDRRLVASSGHGLKTLVDLSDFNFWIICLLSLQPERLEHHEIKRCEIFGAQCPAGLAVLGGSLFSPLSHAQQVYRIVGPDGKVTFSDQPPPQPPPAKSARPTPAPVAPASPASLLNCGRSPPNFR
jgi:hypothetical protein